MSYVEKNRFVAIGDRKRDAALEIIGRMPAIPDMAKVKYNKTAMSQKEAYCIP